MTVSGMTVAQAPGASSALCCAYRPGEERPWGGVYGRGRSGAGDAASA